MDSNKYIHTFFAKNKILIFFTVLAYIGDSLLNIILSWYLQVLLDTMSRNVKEDLFNLTLLFLIFILILIVIMIIKYFSYPRFLEKAVLQYRDQVFHDLLTKNVATFSNEKTATYLSGFTNDMISIKDNYLKNIFNFIQLIIMLIGSLGLMFYYNVYLTLIAILLSILPMLSSILLGGKLGEKERIVSESNEVYVSSLKDILTGFPTIKTFQTEKDVHQQFNTISQTLEENRKNTNKTKELIEGIGSLTGIIAQVGVMLIGAYFVITDSNNLTIGMVIAFTNLMNLVIQPLAVIPKILGERKAAKELIVKLAKNLNNNIVENGTKVLEKGANPPIIRMKNVSYYHEGGNIGVSNVSFKLDSGKIYGIVGGSGSGKSTLLNLIMKSKPNYSGEIFLDDLELQKLTSQSLYNSISLIQQEVFLFDTTIENNVTMFKEFPQKEIDKALSISGLSKLIELKGKDFLVGENGKNLSGGERQRIAIARALIRDNSVILVDEVTSALDNHTAQQINETLINLQGTTRIIVTHRFENQILDQFDEILVMKNGRLVEVGSFKNLMNQKGYFYSLYTVEN